MPNNHADDGTGAQGVWNMRPVQSFAMHTRIGACIKRRGPRGPTGPSAAFHAFWKPFRAERPLRVVVVYRLVPEPGAPARGGTRVGGYPSTGRSQWGFVSLGWSWLKYCERKILLASWNWSSWLEWCERKILLGWSCNWNRLLIMAARAGTNDQPCIDTRPCV